MAFGVKERIKEETKVPTRTRSSAQEKAVAKAVGGVQTPNSGAASIKGDVLTSGNYESSWLLECKTKMKASDSISIKKEWFTKNKYEASEMGKANTALVFNFGPGQENYYIIDETLFKCLMEALNNKE